MLIHEVSKKTGTTKRAIKFYEEHGLLKPTKLSNGYRDYSEEDIVTLKKISLYRKLGISIQDIRLLLKEDHEELLQHIYQQKQAELKLRQNELDALKAYLENEDVQEAEAVEYENVAEAIGSLLPGVWGDCLARHFKPFLMIRLMTDDQKDALAKILDYCDNTEIKVPWLMKFQFKLMDKIESNPPTAEELIARYKDLSDEELNKLKQATLQGAKLKTGILRFHPAYIAQRKLQVELQNKGYNDILIENMKRLSPSYAEYKKALDEVNRKICDDLGLYYDSGFHLRFKQNKAKES